MFGNWKCWMIQTWTFASRCSKCGHVNSLRRFQTFLTKKSSQWLTRNAPGKARYIKQNGHSWANDRLHMVSYDFLRALAVNLFTSFVCSLPKSLCMGRAARLLWALNVLPPNYWDAFFSDFMIQLREIQWEINSRLVETIGML